MKVTLKLYASLGDYLPDPARSTRALDLDLPADATVGDVIEQFNLPRKLCHLVLINGSYVQPDDRPQRTFRDGDVLAIWPPIAGG
jgi:sulfur carrier protein ThiS